MRRITHLVVTGSLAFSFTQAGAAGLPGPRPALSTHAARPAASTNAARPAPQAATKELIARYCLDCHDAETKRGGLSLVGVDLLARATDAGLREKILRKLDHRQMPPPGAERPDEGTFRAVTGWLAGELDRAAAAAPWPGRADALRRLTRTEYGHAIADLLALDVDVTTLLPQDEPGHGFDNVTVGNLSPTLLDRYVSAAQKIARLAVGAPRKAPAGETFRVPADVTQETHVAGLPLGTRGGAAFRYTFPLDGTYELQARLCRDRDEFVEGLKREHEVLFVIDRATVATLKVAPRSDKNSDLVDAHLKVRVQVSAGPRSVGVTFPREALGLIETERTPFVARFNVHRHPRTGPGLFQLTITGPFETSGPGDTPSRRRIFGPPAVTTSAAAGAGVFTGANDEAQARRVLTPIVRRAYRGLVTDEDLEKPMRFFRAGQAGGTDRASFEAGIEAALAYVLASPRFFVRAERTPADLAVKASKANATNAVTTGTTANTGTAYRVSDLELASRLAFFLWSSLPDDELLDVAMRGGLARPDVLEQQARRMLADPRARRLVTNFAAQWLQLGKLDGIVPDLRLFPNYDDNVRKALRKETELFVASILDENRSVTDLVAADYTFLDERLAQHYGVPHVYGSRWRRVSFAGEAQRQRGGLLRQGSILTLTSYATRTSPVIRGHYILSTILGEPPPPPPPNVPALEAGAVSESLPIRERLSAHRANATCAACHRVMDPVGFALENYDAVGRWRDTEEQRPIDATGGLPDGSTCTGVTALEQGLLKRPELLAATLTEKLLTFALGRGVEPQDGPAIRAIVRRARGDKFRLSALVLGVVGSAPFQMRMSP